MTLRTGRLETPIGALAWAERDGCLRAACFEEQWPRLERAFTERAEADEPVRRGPARSVVGERLRAYFAGDLDALADLPVDPEGTPFQQKVWSALREIPPGRTTAYHELARRVRSPEAARAIGAACGANPIWIVIPCHRVVAAGGGLGGYGGGLRRKRWLLEHEGALPTEPAAPR
jgi:methylated-DNA-[protein]-cysteine S-methyltransferase